MKIDAYKTLTTMAQCLQNDDNAKNSPFILVAESLEEQNASVAMCGNAEKIIEMYAAVSSAVADCLKDGLSELEVLSIMARITSASIGKAFMKNRHAERIKKMKDNSENDGEATPFYDEEDNAFPDDDDFPLPFGGDE